MNNETLDAAKVTPLVDTKNTVEAPNSASVTMSGASVEGDFDLTGKGNKVESPETSLETGVEAVETKEDPQTKLVELDHKAQGYNRELDALAKAKESGKPLSTTDFIDQGNLSGLLMDVQLQKYDKQIEMAAGDPDKVKALQAEKRAAAETMLMENEQVQGELAGRAAEAFFLEDQGDLSKLQIEKLTEAWGTAKGREASLREILAVGGEEEMSKAENQILGELAGLEFNASETSSERPLGVSVDLLGEQKMVLESWHGVSEGVDANYQLAMINFAMVVAQIAQRQEDPKLRALMVSVLGNLTGMIGDTIAREQKRIKIEMKEKAVEAEQAKKQEKKKEETWLRGLLKKLFLELLGVTPAKAQGLEKMKMKPGVMDKISASPLLKKENGGQEIASRLSNIISTPSKAADFKKKSAPEVSTTTARDTGSASGPSVNASFNFNK